VEQKRQNEVVLEKLNKEEYILERMNNRMKESDKNLLQIELDDKCMRRDLAVSDSNFEEDFGVGTMCA